MSTEDIVQARVNSTEFGDPLGKGGGLWYVEGRAPGSTEWVKLSQEYASVRAATHEMARLGFKNGVKGDQPKTAKGTIKPKPVNREDTLDHALASGIAQYPDIERCALDLLLAAEKTHPVITLWVGALAREDTMVHHLLGWYPYPQYSGTGLNIGDGGLYDPLCQWNYALILTELDAAYLTDGTAYPPHERSRRLMLDIDKAVVTLAEAIISFRLNKRAPGKQPVTTSSTLAPLIQIHESLGDAVLRYHKAIIDAYERVCTRLYEQRKEEDET